MIGHVSSQSRPESVKGNRRYLVVLLAVAAVARVGYLLFYRDDPLFTHLLHDARRYHEWAMALATGQTWESGPYYQAPLYPWLLGILYRLFGAEPLAMYVLQALAGLATIVLIYRVGCRIAGARVGLAAATLAVLYGTFLFHESKLLPGSLATLLGILAIERVLAADLADRSLSWLTAGAVVGLAALLNPTTLLFGAFCLVWVVIDRAHPAEQRIARAALLAAGIGVLVTPVALLNARAGDGAVLISANGGVTFYQGNNPTALGVFSVPPGFQGSIFSQREESRRLAEAENGRAMSDSAVSRFWFRKGLAFLASDPGRGVWLFARKLGFSLDNHEIPLEYHAALDRNPVRRLACLPFAVVLGLAVARLVGRPRAGRLYLAPALQVLSVLAVLVLFFPAGRYRLPAMPALLIFAGSGAVLLWDRFRSRRSSIVAPAAAAIAAGAFSLWLMPVWAAPVYRFSSAVGHCDLAAANLAVGRLERSTELYREAKRLAPLYPYAEIGLARALLESGDRSGAEEALRRGIALDPNVFQGHFDLGVLLYENGRLPEAADAFRRAWQIDPQSSDAGNNLLGTLARLGLRQRAATVEREMRARGLPVDAELQEWLRSRPGAVP